MTLNLLSRMKPRKSFWLLLGLMTMALVLSGCGVSQEGVDITTTPPDGLWQSLVVWPLGRALIWLDSMLRDANVPYHWGFAIILFTLAVKIVTFPLTLSQMRGLQAQKELQPKIQELQKKYGKDREKLSQEQMKLYQEAGVNPLSGCLPLIIQMPVLFGLYAALVAIGPSLLNANFFWIPNLGYPQYNQGMSWLTESFNNGDYGTLAAYLVLPILLMVTQFIMQKWMTPPTPSTGDANPAAGMTKQLTYVMTFMFGFFTLQVPAGLTLYWVTSNLLQMLQQWAITNERLGLTKPAAKPALATATAGAGATAALTDKSNDKSNSDRTGDKPKNSNGTTPALSTSTTTSGNAANGAAAGSIASGETEEKAAASKEARRRRAKRR